MSRSPFRIMRPFTVSFSGGRTSAYMLRRVLDAYDGALPPDAHVLFANTGKERDETLEFVHEVETRWSVPVTWLEYERSNGDGTREFRVVSYETAWRNGVPGSPFDVLLSEIDYLPNPVARTCTVQLKVKTMRRYLESLGWDRDFHRRTAIGIRSDESDRMIGIMADCPAYVVPVFPLEAAGVDQKEVVRFWKKQPFDLRLAQHEGNCDLCFLKSRRKLVRIAREHPERAEWWVKAETLKEGLTDKPEGARFRADRTYAGIVAEATLQTEMFEGNDDDEIPCACTTGAGDWCDTD